MTNAEQTAEKKVLTAIRNKNNLILFLNRHGEQTSFEVAPTKDPESDAIRLEEAMLAYSSPSFQICTIIDGFITDWYGDEISVEDLSETIKSAEEERNCFYTEKERIFGTTAWPRK